MRIGVVAFDHQRAPQLAANRAVEHAGPSATGQYHEFPVGLFGRRICRARKGYPGEKGALPRVKCNAAPAQSAIGIGRRAVGDFDFDQRAPTARVPMRLCDLFACCGRGLEEDAAQAQVAARSVYGEIFQIKEVGLREIVCQGQAQGRVAGQDRQRAAFQAGARVDASECR